jgi:lipopolysaccharide/colanic/teichoic acid biosynthesis glycosyltransferase
MREVEEKSMGKIKAYMYMNPSAVTLEREIEKDNAMHGIIIADPTLIPPVECQIDLARNNGIQIDFLPNIVETYLKRIPLELIDKFKSHYEIAFDTPDNSHAKRIFDVVVAIIGLILTLPITLFLLIAIPIESGFPVIFKQMRIGYKMKPFKFIKFRSLKKVETKYLDEHENPNDTIEMRVTKIGSGIRKIRFDEIPQFWNVLTGTMSVIGPRPEMENYHKQCLNKIPYYSYRLNFKPGITGWAQINFKHTSGMSEYKEKTEYDLYYIKNRSMLMDLEITLKTFETMIGMRGSK